MDFIAAMYGAYTILMNRESKTMHRIGSTEKIECFKRRHVVQRSRLICVTVMEERRSTLYENIFAKVTAPYCQLPQCFDVRRIDVSNDPMIMP